MRIATLLQKQFDTANPATYITETDGGGAVAAGAASGLRDDLEKRSSLLGSGGRAVSAVSGLRLGRGIRVYAAIRAGRLAPAIAVAVQRGKRKLFPTLFDNYIGRKRDVGGGVLAGLCCLGRFGVSWIVLDGGVRRDY
jgi:hypothetical protein